MYIALYANAIVTDPLRCTEQNDGRDKI